MTITTTRDTDSVQIVLQGCIDEVGADEIKARLRDVVNTTPRRVTVDFAGVTHLGSAGIGKLLVFYKDLALHGGTLQLVRVPPATYRILREMRLESIFAIEEGR